MSKKAKFSLAGTLIYATTSLALPAYAVVKQDLAEVNTISQVELAPIKTVEQANTLYEEKLADYASDNLLVHKEIENLYKIQQLKKMCLEEEKKIAVAEYKKKTPEVEEIDAQLNQARIGLDSKKSLAVLSEHKKDLDEKVLGYYTGLLDEKSNLTYPANMLLESEINGVFKNIVIEADKILNQYYSDDYLSPLLNKTQYNLNDILTVRKHINSKADIFEIAKKQVLRDNIAEIGNKRVKLLDTDRIKAIEIKINNINDKISNHSHLEVYFKNYLTKKNDINTFEKKYGNFNKEINVSAFKRQKLKDASQFKLSAKQKSFERVNKHTIESLESYFKNKNLNVEVEDLNNPAKTLVPLLAGLLLTFALPIARNWLVKAYTSGGKAKFGEYGLSAIPGFLNGALGAVFIDGLHPLVFPVRMLTPLVYQPFFKWMDTNPCKEMNEQ
ncbi:MAG: hypothetical protein KKA79_09985 [Nanoarchaeota archaeon]|nr:hypothetical protein [Nanoarchaeota archaeon]